jgi:hypothetical protein
VFQIRNDIKFSPFLTIGFYTMKTPQQLASLHQRRINDAGFQDER